MSTPAQLFLSFERAQSAYALNLRFVAAGSVRLNELTVPVAFDVDAMRAIAYDPLAYGRTLTAQLLAKAQAREFVLKALASAQTSAAPLRLQLRFSPTALDLHALHWETLAHPETGVPWLTDESVWFSRFLSSPNFRPVFLKAKAELRAVALAANPAGLDQYRLAPVDVAGELNHAAVFLPVTQRLGEAKHASVENLLAALREGANVVYLAAHGKLVKDEPNLFLEDAAGQVVRVSGTLLAQRLSELTTLPQLIVLASCESASAHEALVALGPRLAAIGVPAVLAMQGQVSMETVKRFMPVFFRELARDGQIERALSVARSMVQDRTDGWMPVLFTCLENGQLWAEAKPETPSAETNIAGDVNGPVLSGVFQGAVTVIQNLVRGYEALSTRYDGRVKNFLEFYLGTAESPVPFGGRADSLQALNDWLADDKSPHYALLAAPAGRGKSALLAQWVESVAKRETLHIIYFPLSIRFNTNLEGVVFAALAARAAHLFGEQVALTGDAQQYRGLFTDFLRRPAPDGKPILVVLDGLDEAAGWEWGQDIFPPHAPAHLRVLVAARPLAGDVGAAGWLGRLGWAQQRVWCPPLDPLTRAGVAEVLERMGNPLDALAGQLDVVATLHRLSEGDPLLVRLYVEALTQQGPQAAFLKPADLLTLQPGLGAYFDRWFAEQRKLWGAASPLAEKRVRGLLNLCAVALGPLSKDDLTQLAPDYIEDAWLAAEAARAVERFVIGNGVTVGYTYSHPRLNEYFAAQLGQRELAQWQARFVRYGRETLEQLKAGQLTPQTVAETRAYALRHYAAHLKHTKASFGEIYSLICGEWALSHEKLEGTYAGFLNDLEVAWSYSDTEINLGMQIRCMLFKNSILSLRNKIEPGLLAQCVKENILPLRQALVTIQNFTTFRDVFDRLLALTKVLTDEELQKALLLSQTMGGWLPVWNVLLLGWQVWPEDPDQADEDDLLLLKKRNLRQIFFSENWDLTRDLAQDLADDLLKILAYIGLSFSAMTSGQRAIALSNAIIAAQNIKDGRNRAIALVKLSNVIRVNISKEQEEEIFANTISAACDIYHDKERADALSVLISFMPSDYWPTLLRINNEIKDLVERDQLLMKLASVLPADQLEPIFEQIKDADTYIDALAVAFPRLDYARRINILTEKVELACTPPYKGLSSFSKLASYLSSIEINRIFKTVCFLHEQGDFWDLLSEWKTAYYFIDLAPYLEQENISLALEVIDKFEDKNHQVKVLCKFAEHAPPIKKGQFINMALNAALLIKEDASRFYALVALLNCSPSDLENEIILQAKQAAHTVQDKTQKIQVLLDLENILPTDNKKEGLSAALSVLHEMKESEIQTNVLQDLIEYMSVPDRVVFLRIALKNIAFHDEPLLAIALNHLIPHLDPEYRSEIIAESFTLAKSPSKVNFHCAYALIHLAIYVPEPYKRGIFLAALEACGSIEDGEFQYYLFSEISPFLLPDLFPLALSIASNIKEEGYRAGALEQLAKSLPTELVSLALEAAYSLEGKYSRVCTLCALGSRVSSQKQQEILELALGFIKTLKHPDPSLIASTLQNLDKSSEVYAELLSTAIKALDSISDDLMLAWRISQLIQHIPQEQRYVYLEKAVRLSLGPTALYNHSKFFRPLVDYLTDDLLAISFSLVQAMLSAESSEEDLNQLLCLIIPRLPETWLYPLASRLQHEILNHNRDFAIPLMQIATCLAQNSSADAYTYWRSGLRRLSMSLRDSLHFWDDYIQLNWLHIQSLAFALTPQKKHPQLAADIAQSILDVAKTWP